MDLTEVQTQDLLHLRRLFTGRIDQLARERELLVKSLQSDAAGDCHVSDKLADMTALTEQLRANGNEEYRAHMQLTSAFFRGVSCC